MSEQEFDQYVEELEERLDNGELTHDEEYELYNAAFEKCYGHPAFDEEGNCIE